MKHFFCHSSKVMLFVLFFLVSLLYTKGAFAQIQIKGKVIDKQGEALFGVNVVLGGTTTGTTTDLGGNYSISVPSGKSVLRFSFIGFVSQEVQIGSKTLIYVTLEEATQGLDEVVVVGYGAVKKRDLTGSVVSLKSDDVATSDPVSITQALQGKLAGVQVSQNDGAPGGGVNILIRGTNSFSTSTEPLYVVDGIPYVTTSVPQGNSNELQSTNPLADLNPNNIESVEVLKDASSTAIYGSRGANGVVLITTKSGKAGEDKIEFSSSVGVSRITKTIEMLNGYDYANMRNEAIINKYYYEGGTLSLAYPLEGYYAPSLQNPNDSTYVPSANDFLTGRVEQTDWQNQIFQTAVTQNYNLLYSGGNKSGNYSVSLGYLDQEGIIVNSGYERYNLNININRNLKTWLTVGNSSSFTKSSNSLANTSTDDMGIVRNALVFNPARSVYIEGYDNVSNFEDWNGASNPYTAVRQTLNDINGLSVFNSSYIQIQLFDFLKFRQNVGVSFSNRSRDSYYPRSTQIGKSPTNGYAVKSDSYWNGLTTESLLTFDKKISEKQSVNAVFAWTYEKANYGNKYIRAQNFPNDYLTYNSIQDALDEPVVSSGRGMYALMSYLGRVNYSLLDRYLFTISFRRDGSSRFSKTNRWAFFSSYALAWRLSEERFIKELGVFDNLKVRASYGATGNQGISAYATQAMLGDSPAVVNGQKYSGYADITWRGPSNPNLRWETVRQYNLGIDVGVLDNRLSFVADAYHKETEDLLQRVQIPSSTGFSIMSSNSGRVINKGIEFSANAVILEKPLKWIVDANISFNRNHIEDLDGDQFASSIGWNMDDVFIQRNGDAIGTIWGYKSDGFYDSEAEVRADPAYTEQADAVIKAMIGQPKYVNMDEDPKSISTTDKTIIGDVNPDYTFGITNRFEYKNFSLSFFFQGSIGNDIVNTYYYKMNSDYGFSYNIPKAVYDSRWIPEDLENGRYSLESGCDPEWQILSSSLNRRNLFSDKMIEDGSYLRLKNINLSYTVKKPLHNIQSINIYTSLSNVLTWTNYSWYDPEVNAFGSDPSRRGVDLDNYPTSRTFTIGVKCTF